jgi:ABC-type nitrate/sulfonate/bicarbonate transport system permease component
MSAGGVSGRRSIGDGQLRLLLGSLSVLVLLAAWQGAAGIGWVDARFSSEPSRVAAAAVSLLSEAEFWWNVWVSFSEFFCGMLAACVVGMPLGIAMGWFRRLRLLLDPIVMVFYSVPGTTFLPLIILWFGIDLKAYAFLVFLSALFPILVSSMVGMQQVDPILVLAARSFCASQLGIFRHVLLPSSLPFIMTGIRLGLGRGLTGIVLGEMYFSIAGLGHMIMRYQAGLNTDRLMVLICFIATAGVGMIALARRVEGQLRNWRHSREVE